MGWLTQQFLSDVNPKVSVFMDAVIQIQMPTWHQGRVALVGDACDCPTLLSGQGASLAMGGAYLLAVRCTTPPITRKRSGATNSRCLPTCRHSKRVPVVLPNPFCLAVPSACSSNKR